MSARREQCFENLLRGTITLPTDVDFGLEGLSDTEVSDTLLPRRIVPEQAISPGELVHIINYDQLEQIIDCSESSANTENSSEDHALETANN